MVLKEVDTRYLERLVVDVCCFHSDEPFTNLDMISLFFLHCTDHSVVATVLTPIL